VIDLAATAAGIVFVALVSVGARRGAGAHPRVVRDGGSVLLDARAMSAAYRVLEPVARACVRRGISANAVTFASLVLGLLASVLLAFGHFGLAALAAAASSAGDAVDGLVATETNTASAAGEVLDAAVDRYCELFFFGGLAVHYGAVTSALVLTLGALLGAFMVSYATAKADALGVAPPRGAMRRPERALYLAVGALLVPLAKALTPGLPWWAGESPILVALALVAVVGNVSAVRRLVAIARTAAARAAS
jgi:CDP-diacylglycerol--glycerol-3-phosphate 3-phosphatidyltransferase